LQIICGSKEINVFKPLACFFFTLFSSLHFIQRFK
jgi:hypothetical protein